MRISDWSSDVCSSDLLASSTYGVTTRRRSAMRMWRPDWVKAKRLYASVATLITVSWQEPSTRFERNLASLIQNQVSGGTTNRLNYFSAAAEVVCRQYVNICAHSYAIPRSHMALRSGTAICLD